MNGLASYLGRCSGLSKHTFFALGIAFALLGAPSVFAQTGGFLDVEIAGNGGGTVTSDDGNINCPGDCSQTYFNDTDMVTLMATASPGSQFTGWEGACAGSGTGDCTVTMAGGRNVTARFTAPVLNVTRIGTGSGSVQSDDDRINCPADCSETYDLGDQVTLTATPAADSTFIGWQGGGCSGTDNCNVTLSNDVAVSAIFDRPNTPGGVLSVAVNGTGSGSVTSNDQAIDCPGDCSETYSSATTVTLTATAGVDSTFAGWQGACSGTDSCVVTIPASQSVTATFTAIAVPRQLSVDVSGMGQVTSDDLNIACPEDCSESYANGETVILTAGPADGHIFTGWQGGGCSGTGSCTVTMSQDRNVTALFETAPPDDDFLLAVDLAGTGGGTVSSGDQNIDCPGTCSSLYPPDSTVTLSASADPGSVFAGWQGAGCSGTAPCSVNLQGNRNVTAIFNIDTTNPPADVRLTVSVGGAGSGQVQSSDGGINCPSDCAEDYVTGSLVRLSATADANSVFAGWQGGGCSGTGNCVVSMSQSQDVSALFDPQTGPDDATLRVSTAGSGQGVVQSNDGAISCPESCSQTYSNNEVITLTALPEAGSVFAGWQGGSCSGTGSCVVTLSENRDVAATFQVDGDQDNDLVPNTFDQCPNTPAGETVDAVGCSVTQPQPQDDDRDGVPNTIDQCPNTPPGAAVDAVGCSEAQEPDDDDGDGVPNLVDQCPNTPPGAAVDAVGCSANQQPQDDDMDDVPNTIDQCANTPAGDTVDNVGCSLNQNDSDGDGVVDGIDACPNTAPFVAAVDGDGCPIVLQFGNQLGALNGLGANERNLGTRLDEICPMLARLDDFQSLTDGESDLRDACLRLKDTDTTEEQAAFALREISLTGLASQKDYAVDIATSQYRHVGNRMNQLKTGGGGGVSVSGLNLDVDGQQIPGHVLQSAMEGLLGLGASGDSFADFGKLGLFLQGDLDFGERDETALETGYEFDSWSVTLGADYRFSDTLFLGASASLGDVEVDYDGGDGSTDISNWALSVYAGWSVTEKLYIDGLISYGESDLESVRNVSYVDAGGAFDSSHNGDTEGDQLFLGINMGYVLNRGSWRFGPTASLAYLDGTIDGFTETSREASSQAWNFHVEEQDIESLRLSVGAQADYIINTSFGVIIPGIRLSYVLETEDGANEVGLRLVNNPFAGDQLVSDRLTVRSDGEDSSFLDTSFNVSGQFVMGFSAFFSYQFYSGFDDYSRDGYTLGVRWDKPF